MPTTKLTGTFIRSGSIPTTALGGGVVSSSVQITSALPTGTVSSSAQIDYNSIQNKLSGVVSSSTQVQPLLPAGTLSSSTQVNAILDADGVFSSSNQVVVQNTTGIGALATTGSNVFTANQTITGSLFISQNLVVQGSSSISYISQSTLNVGTNKITMNTNTPGVRFGGIEVIDSGSSPLRSGSLYFDSINDQWIFVHQNTAGGVTSSVVVVGPATFNNVGNETLLTQNRVLKASGLEHVTDSQITDNGVTVSITNGLSVGTNLTSSQADITTLRATSITASVSGAHTGTFPYASLTGLPTLVSASSQVDHNTTTNYVANQHIDHTTVSIIAGSGLTGGGTIAASRTLTALYIPSTDNRSVDNPPASSSAGLYADFKTNTTDALIDGGTYHGVLTFRPYGTTSDFSGGPAYQQGFTQNGNLYLRSGSSNTWSSWRKFAYETGGVVSSSAQVIALLPAGTVSSSTQEVANLQGQRLNLSGSQFTGITSGSGLAYRFVVPVGTNLYAT